MYLVSIDQSAWSTERQEPVKLSVLSTDYKTHQLIQCLDIFLSLLKMPKTLPSSELLKLLHVHGNLQTAAQTDGVKSAGIISKPHLFKGGLCRMCGSSSPGQFTISPSATYLCSNRNHSAFRHRGPQRSHSSQSGLHVIAFLTALV